MTISVETPYVSYAGDGVTVAFPIPFTWSAPGDIVATVATAGIPIAPSFSVTGVSGSAMVVFAAAPAMGTAVVLTRGTPLEQDSDFVTGNAFVAAAPEGAFDRAMRIAQELWLRCIHVGVGDRIAALPSALVRAGGLLGFGSTGDPIIVPLGNFAGPPGGNVLSIGLFASLSTLSIPLGTSLVQTSGNTAIGVGVATYVEDAQSLAIGGSMPDLCRQSANGRWFRLLPRGGKIAATQAGFIGGDANDQPTMQQSIDYCGVVQCPEIRLDLPVISCWATMRTSNAGQNTTDAWAQDGQFLWITKPIKLTGLSTVTHLKMLSTTGGSLETDWQTVAAGVGEDGQPHVWRGSGINLIGGSQVAPTANGLSSFAMENVWLDGGCDYSGVRTAVTPGSPDGPDLTNKGIRLQDTQCDAITLTNCIINGFKGEAYYCAGTAQCVQSINGCAISGSNQSALNPSSGPLYVSDSFVGNSFIAMECLARTGGWAKNTKFYNAAQLSVTGGPANGLLYNYAFPTRDLTLPVPWFDLVDCEFLNVGQMTFANYVRVIQGRATDCGLSLTTALTFGAFVSTYIDLDVTIDKMNLNPLCVIQGAPTTTTVIPGATGANYTQPVNDVHIRLNIRRTANAKAADYFCVPFADSGLIDQDTVSYTIEDCDGVTNARTPNYGGGTSLSMPLVVFEGPTNSQLIGSETPFAAYPLVAANNTYAMPVSNPRHVVYKSGTAGAVAITMAPGAYANGQRCRIFGPGSGSSLTFARNGTGLRLNSDCVLTLSDDSLDIEYHTSTQRWHDLGSRSVYAA